MCPFELGDPRFLPTMISLYNQPACCIILRRFNAIQILLEYKKKLRTERKVNLTITNSATWTHRVIKSFFDNSELYQDEFSRPHAKYLPPCCIEHMKLNTRGQELQVSFTKMELLSSRPNMLWNKIQ